jgi:protein phosphatase 2C family protein 2/3
MEDSHAAILDLHSKYVDKNRKPTDPDKRLAFFGVYDGHGGEQMAVFAGENVHKIVAKQESFAKGDIEQSLRDGFLATDRAILEGECCACFSLRIIPAKKKLLSNPNYPDPKYEEEVSGCTASVAIISRDKIRVVRSTAPGFDDIRFLH